MHFTAYQSNQRFPPLLSEDAFKLPSKRKHPRQTVPPTTSGSSPDPSAGCETGVKLDFLQEEKRPCTSPLLTFCTLLLSEVGSLSILDHLLLLLPALMGSQASADQITSVSAQFRSVGSGSFSVTSREALYCGVLILRSVKHFSKFSKRKAPMRQLYVKNRIDSSFIF